MGLVDTLNGVVLGLLVVAAVLSWPLAWMLLRWYRRSVVRVMETTSQPVPSRPVPYQPGPPAGSGGPASTAVLPRSDEQRWWEEDGVERHLRDRARAGRHAVWRRHALGGTVAATVLALATMLAAGPAFLPVRTLVIWVVSAWPLVLTLGVLSGFDRRVLARATGGYALLLLGLALAAGVRQGFEAAAVAAPFLLWGLTAGLPTLIALLYLHRSVRAVGVVVVAFLYVGLLGANGMVVFMAGSVDGIRVASRIATVLGVGAITAVVGMNVIGFGVAALAGWLALRGFGRAYRDHGLPSDMVQVGAIWLLFAGFQGIPLAFTSPVLPLAAPIAVTAFWLLASRPVRNGDDRSGPRLLMLRVFAGGRRNEDLFRRVTTTWQDVGPIRLIGGPDLARANVQPDGFLHFAAGRLDDLFVTGPEQLERRRHDPREVRDRHGRYRVQEFLCTADTWRPVVHGLMQDTDLVVVDLRNLSPGNEGIRQELAMLVELGMLSRTLLVVDGHTDQSLVTATIEASNGRLAEASVAILDDGELSFDDLLSALTFHA